jgi:hypothetical protein
VLLNGSMILSKLSARLDAVSKARQAYVLARTTLEQRLRVEMREELSNLQTQVDIAVRYAYDAGESKSAILRALGLKNFAAVQESLDRTNSVAEVVGDNPHAGVYAFDGAQHDRIVVSYTDHGPLKANGSSVFSFRTLDDGRILFAAVEPLWDATFTVRNDAVAYLDGKMDGWYYEEVCAWILGK